MKKLFALILAAAMVFSLAACGGKTETSSNTPQQTSENTKTDSSAQTGGETNKVAEGSYANGDGSYRFLYGWENQEATLYTPENAVSEGEGIYDVNYVPKDNVFQGMSLTFQAEDESWYCQARDWQSNTANSIEHLAQYYFTGKVEDADLKDYSQEVTDLGFKWLGKPVQLIVSTYQTSSGLDYIQSFVGVEYDNKTAPDKGKGLVGLDFFYDEFTKDQLAYVAGQIFGVDSGVKGDPFAEGGSEPVAAIDSSAIIGSWIDPESTWGTCFTFKADGSGARSATVTGESKPFTYKVEGNQIKLRYDDGLEDQFTAAPLGAFLNLTDSYGTTTKYEASEEPAAATEAGLSPAMLAGTWLDSDGDGFSFNEDGTGSCKIGSDSWQFTYSILNGDSVSINYDDGDHATFYAELEGDTLTFDKDEWVMTRQ